MDLEVREMTTLLKQPVGMHKAIGSIGISALIILVTGICVFTPSILFFRQLASYTFYIMLGFMALGFLAFLLRQERIMIVSLSCCCILCLYLKGSSNKQMRLPAVTDNPSLKVAHINLGNAENDYARVVEYLLHLDVDIISFQELTPDWTTELTKVLAEDFHYINTMTRMDQYGMGFFSRTPFLSIDTMQFQSVPNLMASVSLGGDHLCHVISCQVVPPVNQAAFTTISKHFNDLAGYVKEMEGNVIVLGDLHLPPWDYEIQQFKFKGNLQDSRRDSNPRNPDGSFSLPRIPVEHIFYGKRFECTSFSELGNNVVGRLGITGTYQIHDPDEKMVQ